MAKKKKTLKSPRKETTHSKRGGTKAKKKVVKKKSVIKVKLPEPKKASHKDGAGFSSNNFNYIRALLWKTHKSDFKGYFDPEFIRKVNAVYYDCKASGGECTDEFIFEHYNIVKEDERRPYPEISKNLYEFEQIYYEIKDVEFQAMPPYLWILSPMIITDPSEFIVPNYYYNYLKLVNEVESDSKIFADEVKNFTGKFNNLTAKHQHRGR